MNFVQKWLVGLTSKNVPEFRNFVESAGGTLELASGVLRENAAQREEWRRVTEQRTHQLLETQAICGSGPGMGESQFKERLWELELALEDRGWQRQLAVSQMEFSRYGIQQLILISRLYKIKNPLIKRGVEISAFYVFGRGVEIVSDNDAVNQQIEDFLSDPSNAKELGHAGLVEKHESLETDGNLFFAFFSDKGTGETKVRTIDALEIQEIITDPDDSSVPWFYRRSWAQQNVDAAQGLMAAEQMNAWYPALGIENSGRTAFQALKGYPVTWETPVYHVKEGGLPKWHFGCPKVYAAIDWADAYKHFLEDWATITRQLARFGWNVETPGGQQGIQSTANALSTTLAQGGSSIERNPPPTVGAAFVTGKDGVKMTPFKTSGATTEPEQGRRVMLMVAAAFGLPETFFGDASTGSLATAQSLDRPTELKFKEAQERWRETLITIFSYVVSTSARAPKGTLRESIGGKRIRFVRALPKLKESQPDNDVSIMVKFPAILEHDIAAMVDAIVDGATLKGWTAAGVMDKKTIALAIMGELGIENPEQIFESMYPAYDPQEDDGTGQTPPPPQPGTLPTPTPTTEVMRMARSLARAVERLTPNGATH